MVHRLVSLKVYPKIRVKTVLVNPTKYYARPYLTRYNYKDNVEEHEEFSGNAREENRTVVEGYNVLQDDAEFDQGIFYFFYFYYFSRKAPLVKICGIQFYFLMLRYLQNSRRSF